jgi:hypothetical protein
MTQRTTALGQRRFYTSEPLRLAPAVVWKDLSHGQYAASQALREIHVTWDREDDDTLIMDFANTQGEQFEAYVSVRVDNATDFDEADPASIARFALHQSGWRIESGLVRESDQNELDNDELFDTIDSHSITVGDIWPALQALHACVCAHSERIYGMDDPQEPLFCRNTNAAADKTYPDQPGAIIAEKRVLAYQDYLLNLDGFDINLSPREQTAFALMADLHITWMENGDPSTEMSFIAPNEFGYAGEVIPIWEQETGSEACWDVEVHSNQTTKQMKREDIYSRLPNGETVTFAEVRGVLVVLHQFLTQCEEEGYPAFDDQIL